MPSAMSHSNRRLHLSDNDNEKDFIKHKDSL